MQVRKNKQLLFKFAITALFIISFAIFFWFIYRERDVLFSYKWELRWRFAGLSMIFFTFAFGIAAAVWTDIMRAFGSETTIAEHIRYFGFSQLAKRLPGTIWYFFGREYLYKQQRETPWLASVASGLELVISTIAGSLLAVSLVSSLLIELSYIHFIGFVLLIIGALVLAHPKVMQQLLAHINFHLSHWPRYRQILGWIGAYLFVWVLGGMTFWAITSTFVVVEYSAILFFVGAWSLVGVLSVLMFLLPTNLGFSEIGLSIFLAYFFPLPLAVALAILNRISLMLYDIGIAIAITLVYTAFQKIHYQKTLEKQL